MAVEIKTGQDFSEWKIPTDTELKHPDTKEIEDMLKPWYLQVENRHQVIGGKQEMQNKVDKVNALFELGILPKIDKETGNDLKDMYISYEITPTKKKLEKSGAQRTINNLESELIGYLDRWESKKTKPPKGYENLNLLISDLKELSRARFGEFSNEKRANIKTGLPEDENDLVTGMIKEKLRSADLV